MSRLWVVYLPAFVLVFLCIYLTFNPELLVWARNYISEMGTWGMLVYVLLLMGATVFAPVTVVPIIPLAATAYGPIITGILSVIGWTAGAVIAFLLARKIGRPLVEKLTSLDKVDQFIASFPPHLHFWFILILRHTVPVDILSYALGMTKTVRFSTYFWATLLGVSYFSFAFAYLGEAMFTGNFFLLFELGLFSLVILVIGWYLLQRNRM